MPSVNETSCFDQHFNVNNSQFQKAKNDINEALTKITLPVAAQMLTAFAVDVVTSIQNRNDRPDVRAAVASLQASLAVLQAIDPGLEG